MKKLLFDTNVLIDYMQGLGKALLFLEQNKDHDWYISTINITELYAGIRNSEEEKMISMLLQLFTVLSIDSDMAILAGKYKQQYGKSHGVCIADATIAALTLTNNLELVTCNKKHFPNLKNVTIPYKK